jgi:HEAT repeat protein
VEAASRWLRSENEVERQRAFERLSSVGTTQALDLLVKALEPGGPARTPRDRLVLVRALAKHAKVSAVRELLVRIVTGLGTSDRADALDELTQGSAALALAKSGDREALNALGKALRQPGRIAEVARGGLLAYPPASLGPLLEVRSAPTRSLAATLGELGDQRARAALREFINRGTPEVRAEAAVALTKLGAEDGADLARRWLRTEKQPFMLVAAARVLVMLRAAEAAQAVLGLLKRPETQEIGLELALTLGSPVLVPELSSALSVAHSPDENQLIAALGRAGGAAAAKLLAKELTGPRAALAAQALALATDEFASAELERALGQSASRRWAVRAAVVRKLVLNLEVSGLRNNIAALRTSPDAADRAASAFADAMLDEDRARALLRHPDPILACAAAPAVLIHDLGFEAARLLTNTKDRTLLNALAIALANPRAANEVATRNLRVLLEAGGVAAYLAARTLAVRDSETERARLEELLSSEDTLMRQNVALGFGQSAESSAVGLLAKAYRFESDASVRRSIIYALSQRTEPARSRTLRLAAELDPDSEVRSAARLALTGRRLEAFARGNASVWLSLTETQPIAARQTPASAAIVLGSGLALPSVAAPDGAIIFAGLDVSRFTLRLAAGTQTDKAAKPKP